MNKSSAGQSLIELVVGIAIGVLFITGALGIITVTLRLDLQNKYGQAAGELAQQITEQVSAVANADWHSMDGLNYGPNNPYHLEPVGNFLVPFPNSSTTLLNGELYTYRFNVESVNRDELGHIVTEGGTVDPATIKITATVNWSDKGETSEAVFTRYLARNRNRVSVQKNWAQGLDLSEVPVAEFNDKFASSSNLRYSIPGEISILNLSTSTPIGIYSNIDPVFRYAWSDVVGWLDFQITGTVHVTSTKITGFANSSAVGFIAMNCDSTPPYPGADVCPPLGPSQFGVANDGVGNLSGMAWNDMLGWISFKDTVTPLTPAYQVTIDQSTGDFHGFAWNDVAGWISFNCVDTPAGCGASNYKVRVNSGTPIEATVASRIYDTSRTAGSAPNTILWNGIQPPGTRVRFQIATECINIAQNPPNCGTADDWRYIGPSGDSATYYEDLSGVSIPITRTPLFPPGNYNKQYLRYKAFLYSDPDRLTSPTINSISINWSL